MLFRIYDKNGDGSLTKKELRHSIRHAMKTGKKIMQSSSSTLRSDLGSKGAKEAHRMSAEMASKEVIDGWVEEASSPPPPPITSSL